MDLVFYDLEATGPDPLHDQVLSAAAVLTDEALNEKDRFSMRCRLRPHQLPSAAALLLTGLSIDAITDPSLPSHRQLVTALRERFLSWQPAVFAGYSSLEFDELLLSQSLRRCLYPAGLTHGWRLDVQRLALGIDTFFPGVLNFATRFDGKPSFRLARLAAANGLEPGRPHDAMADVSATIAVAKLMRHRAPWLWSHMLRMGNPDMAASFATETPVRLYTAFHHNRPHHWLVTALGRAPADGDVIGFDLSRDPREGQGLDHSALLAWLRRHPSPLRPIRLADCPFILPRSLAAGRVEAQDADARAAMLAADGAYRARLLAAHAELDPPKADPVDGAEGMLLRYEEEPESLSPGSTERIEAEIAARMLAGESAHWMTLDRAFDEADAAFEGATPEQAEQLEALLGYLRREMTWAEARSAPQNRLKPNR